MERSIWLILPFSLFFTLNLVNCRRVIRAEPDAKTTGYFIVRLEQSLTHEEFVHTRNEILKDCEGFPVYEADNAFSKVLTVKVKKTMLDKVKHIRGVEYIEEETYAYSTEIPWSLDQIDQCSETLDNRYQPIGDGEGIDIYILDTGIRYSHSEFEGRARYSGKDPTDEYYGTNQMGLDCHGHGTHVASLAAGKTFGAAKKSNIYSVRVLDCDNRAPLSIILNGLNHVAELVIEKDQPAIISMSLGGPYSTVMDELVTAIVQADIPVVAAAGNNGKDACHYSPASNSLAITVGASKKGAGMFSYSNGGSCVDIIAPGVDVLGASWLCDSCTMSLTGTSMATPLVSGIAAIHLSFQPLLTPSELKHILLDESCKNILNFDHLQLDCSVKFKTPNRLLHITRNNDSSASATPPPTNVRDFSDVLVPTPSPTIENDIRVLPFLDLGNDTKIFTGVDDSSVKFNFPEPFHFNQHTFTSGHISSNGLISFGSSFTEFSPRLFPINEQVIAPYWYDIDLREGGYIMYDSFNALNGSQVLKNVSDFINSVESPSTTFEASSVVVVYWRDTCPFVPGGYACSSFETNSFQLVLVSNNETSFAVFTYECGSLNWANKRVDVSIGFSGGEDFFFNHHLSRKRNVICISCLNLPITPWMNIVFNSKNNLLDFPLPTSTPSIEEDFSDVLVPTPSPTIENEINVLPFLDLGSTSRNLSRERFSYSLFQFPQPFHFNLETFNYGHIFSNGVISFGRFLLIYFPDHFPTFTQVIAPYWDDTDLSERGSVIFDSFNAHNGSHVLIKVSDFINSVQGSITFEASSVNVIYWKDICPYGNPKCSSTNSFQAVLASDDETSFAVFTYKCGSLNWGSFQTSIGYSAGNDFFFNHPLSGRINVNDIACVNQPFTPWSNLVFNFENNGSCVENGYQGCCDSGALNCSVSSTSGSCYCDQLCHHYNDCCSDILEIGCFDLSEAMQSATSDVFLPSSTPTIEEESSVLPFLDLGNSANTFFGVDDDAVQFEFPQTFHFNQETFKFGYISSNGLISFGSPYREYITSVFPINAKVIAPYWADIDLGNRGSVIFDSFDAHNKSHVIKIVSDYINSVEKTPDLFEASAVVVIYWKDVCPIRDPTCSRANSFQLVLASSEETSFAVFTYKCGSLNWVTRRTSIGYSGGEDFFSNHPLSRTANVNDIACLNHPITPWSNVVLNCKNEIQSSHSLLPIPTSTIEGEPSEIIPTTDYLLPTPTPTVEKQGSCVERGFQGCCVSGTCFVSSPSGGCYCDQICHYLHDCCSDILEIGCFDPSQSSSFDFVLPTPSPTLGEGSSTTSIKSSSPSPSPTNEESISVLPFLDLGSNASVFTGVDDSSVQFQFPQPFHFNQEIFTSAFISTNGMISFGSLFTEFLSGLFPISAQVISPYWDDIDLRNQGSVNFASFNNQNGSQVLRKVSDFINSVQRPQTTMFEAHSVVVVYWRETCPFRNSTCSHTNSFQVVLASSNQTSFAVFTYKCGLLNWIRNKASIGFSSGEDFFFNHPLSKLPNVNNIACLNQILTPWSNVVFNSKNGITYSNDLTSATPPPRNDTEISILPFLDLGSKANIFTGVDDSSRHFQFPQPFRFNHKIFTSGHISSNGLISFGKSFISHLPRLFPINTQVISPYWDDINLRDRGSILFDSFTVENGSQVLKNISNFINSVPRSATVFEASSAIVVYWKDTCPFENSTCSSKNSFQVVLASNNQTSFAIYTYKCGMLNWVKNRASIGYSAGKDSFFNHPLSKRLNINDIACLNKQITPWSNVAFNSEKGTMLHLMYSRVMPV